MKNIKLLLLLYIFLTSCSLSIKQVVMTNNSMLPAIAIGDRLTYAATLDSLNYTDLVIFEPPKNDDFIYDKGPVLFRVVGLPGDSITIENNICIINGKKNKNSFIQKVRNKDSYVKELEYLNEYEEAFPNGKSVKIYCFAMNFSDILSETSTIFVPEKHYFLMGDFRSNAYDSRYIGVIPVDKIKGKIVKIEKGN